MTKLSIEFNHWKMALVRQIPGAVGAIVRYNLYSKMLAGCGKNFYTFSGCHITGFRNIMIGDNVYCNHNVVIRALDKGKNSIVIGDNVIIGPNVVIVSSNHRSEGQKDILFQGHESGHVMIGMGTWIGAGAIILPDVTIGMGAIIGAGAVVAGNVEEFSVVAGNPAKKIGERGPYEAIKA